MQSLCWSAARELPECPALDEGRGGGSSNGRVRPVQQPPTAVASQSAVQTAVNSSRNLPVWGPSNDRRPGQTTRRRRAKQPVGTWQPAAPIGAPRPSTATEHPQPQTEAKPILPSPFISSNCNASLAASNTCHAALRGLACSAAWAETIQTDTGCRPGPPPQTLLLGCFRGAPRGGAGGGWTRSA